MRSVLHLLPLLLLVACVDLAPPATVIDQPEVGGLLDVRDARPPDGRHDLPISPPPSPDAPGGTDAADADADPVPTPPGDAAPEASRKNNGEACVAAAECQSDSCADGLCCNNACAGACQACDRLAQPGTCGPIAAGEDPKDDCALEPATSCGRDGTCDGQGACRRYAEGSTCAPGSCASATERAASTCRQGTCQAGNTRSCAPGVCMGTSCGTTCSGPADCQTGFFCDQGRCQAKHAAGVTCAAAGECDSGNCVDGVCCGTTCGGGCQACNLAGALGVCTPIPDGADPATECPAQASNFCGRTGGCNGSGACRQRAAGTSCGSASCTAGSETTTATCNGVGTCSPGTSRDCGGYTCGATTCRTSCTSASDCKSGYKCASGLSCLVNKIASLVVHDQARASGWALRANFSIGSSGAHPWLEWPNSYIASVDAAGSVLMGNEWVRVATDSKNYTGGPQASITLATAADVYITIDDRWGSSPSFTAGWSNVGWKIRVYESASRPSLAFSVYRKSGQTGTVTFPAIGATTAYNYFIVVH